ncbi:jg5987 [Pararge aegeria aegeria]|uniref:Jg5987 protein n=1 Tax=Pararge aegeria aegeria TaxID=348720 RepID=A0A8S4SEB3_9NEOP|nr:jg5987 [Pararge aegeria aegeria]
MPTILPNRLARYHLAASAFTTRDLHFHNGCIRFLPSESPYRLPEYRMKLKPGPGVDFRGQMPIPQELLMKRGKSEKEDGGKVRKVKQD